MMCPRKPWRHCIALLCGLPLVAAGEVRAADEQGAAAGAPTFTFGGVQFGRIAAPVRGAWAAAGAFAAPSTSPATSASGWLYGVQAGFGWRFDDGWVIGIEGDLQWTQEKDTFNFVFPVTIGHGRTGLGGADDWSLPYLAGMRGRIGWTPSSQWLVYGSGGLAYGRADFGLTGQPAGAAAGEAASAPRWGWTAGVGAEFSLLRNFSAKVEYQYLDLGTAALLRSPSEMKLQDHVVRFGVNWRFEHPGRPRD